MDGPLAVVGAGIAGLATALALARIGIPVEIFEKAQTLRPIGAGIQLSPNAMACLRAIGVAGEVAARGRSADVVVLRSGRTGREIARVPVRSPGGEGYISIHRAELQAVLLGAVGREPSIRLNLGSGVSAIRQSGSSVGLVLTDESGPRPEPDRDFPFVVAADGARSTVAAALGLPPPTVSGHRARRFATDGSATGDGGSIEAWLSAGRHAVAYPLADGRTNIVLVDREEPRADRVWEPRLADLLARADAVGEWPLLTSDRRLLHGRVILVGDAAHAMLPFAAQGAATAIEDAVMLAHAFSRNRAGEDLRQALQAFEDERLQRLARVRARVRFHDRVYHLPFPLDRTRDLVLRSRTAESLARDLSWLYGWRPPAL